MPKLSRHKNAPFMSQPCGLKLPVLTINPLGLSLETILNVHQSPNKLHIVVIKVEIFIQ